MLLSTVGDSKVDKSSKGRNMNSYIFWRVSNSEDSISWIAAQENFGEHRIFVWVGNTRLWHHHNDLENDFYNRDRIMIYLRITAEEVNSQLPFQALLGERTKWILDILKQAPVRTHEEIGL